MCALGEVIVHSFQNTGFLLRQLEGKMDIWRA